MRKKSMFAAFVALLLVLLAPQTTHACSCAPNVQLVSPIDGAQAVPLDIAPLLTGNFDGSSVQWTAADGRDVSFTSRSGRQPGACIGTIMELIPSQPLAAATSYVIRVAPRTRASAPPREFRFTTGDTKVAQAALPDPSLTITLVRGRAVYDSCVDELHGCLAVGAYETDLSFLDADDRLLSWMLLSGSHVIERGAHPDTVCVEARTRDRAGRRSAAVRRCGAELGLRADRVSDYDNYRLRCSEGRILDAPVAGVSDASVAALPAVRTDASAAQGSTGARLHDAASAAHEASGDEAANARGSDEPATAADVDERAQPGANGCVAAPGAANGRRSSGWLLLLASALWLRVRRHTTHS